MEKSASFWTVFSYKSNRSQLQIPDSENSHSATPATQSAPLFHVQIPVALSAVFLKPGHITSLDLHGRAGLICAMLQHRDPPPSAAHKHDFQYTASKHQPTTLSNKMHRFHSSSKYAQAAEFLKNIKQCRVNKIFPAQESGWREELRKQTWDQYKQIIPGLISGHEAYGVKKSLLFKS